MERHVDLRSSSSHHHQPNASTSSDSVLVRGSVLRASGSSNTRSVSLNDSADKRLDELITNGLTNGAPVPVKGDVQNIRCLSPPPPLPPRQGREQPNLATTDPLVKRTAENSHVSSTSSSSSEQNESSRIQTNFSDEIHAPSERVFEDDDDNDDDDDDGGGEYVFPKELLVNLNKQILDTQQKHRLSTRQQNSPTSPQDDVCKYVIEQSHLSLSLSLSHSMSMCVSRSLNNPTSLSPTPGHVCK